MDEVIIHRLVKEQTFPPFTQNFATLLKREDGEDKKKSINFILKKFLSYFALESVAYKEPRPNWDHHHLE